MILAYECEINLEEEEDFKSTRPLSGIVPQFYFDGVQQLQEVMLEARHHEIASEEMYALEKRIIGHHRQ